ncbi:MAG: TetR/AcrR family transcriptional regulator [Solirubrobacterales bacterium]|nr:TetR/AcrR family transcriptional regulator [Solirubrobacterales bacterium]
MAATPTDTPTRVDHRARLLAGMAASVRAKGFPQTTLADVVREARVSRRTFYEHFSDPLDCYVALLESIAQRCNEAIAAAAAGGGTPEERLDRAVGSYLDLLEADPLLMRSFLRELHLTGERGRLLLNAVNAQAGALVHALVEEVRAAEPELGLEPIPVDMARMIVAGIVQLALMAHDDGQPLDAVRATATALLRRVVAA